MSQNLPSWFTTLLNKSEANQSTQSPLHSVPSNTTNSDTSKSLMFNPEAPPAPVRTKLYVSNFAPNCTRRNLTEFYSRFGQVLECAIMWDSYAFIHFGSVEEASHALRQASSQLPQHILPPNQSAHAHVHPPVRVVKPYMRPVRD